MFVQVDRLANHYADILAGGDQTIVGLPPHPPKDPEKAPEYSKASLIDNLTAELSRTTQFNNISYTYAGAAETWTMPSQRYTIGQIGGRITSGGHQYIAAVDVNNRLQSLHTTTHVEHPPLGDLHTSPPMPLMPELTPAPSTDQSAEEPALSVESQLPLTIPDTTLQDLADARLPTLHTDNAPISVAAPPWATATTVPGPLILPNNRLFTVHPDAVSLIVTDPHFSGGSDRTTADRQLQALNDPLASMHKRLGDGFYEQRLIREQIAQLTGRRLLDGYANDDQQYRALLDAGVTVAQHYGLRPGIALSADQMAQLTSDIVWLVEQPVTLPNGTSTTALVPRVYLRPRRGDLKTDGALMAGARLTMDLSGTLSNTGTLTGRDRLTIDADNIHQEGGQMDADHVKVHTKDTLTDIGGTFSARSSLDVTAAGGLIARSTTRGYSTSGQRHFSRTEIDRPSAFRVTGPGGTLHVTSDKDMTLQGVTFSNTGPGGTSTVTAAGKLNMATVAVGETNTATLGPGNSIHSTRDSEVGTRITGTGNVTIKGEGGVIGRAVTLDSRQGKLNISSADGTVALVAGQERRTGQEERTSRRSGLWGSSRSHSTASSQDTIALGSVLGGTKVTVTGDKVYSVGTDFIADGNPHIEGTHGVGMFGAQNTHSSSYSTTQRRSGVFGSGAGFTVGSQKASQQGSRHATYLTGNTVAALNGNILIHSSKGAVQAPGIDLIAPEGNIDIHGKKVAIVEARETEHTTQETKFRQSGLTASLSNPAIAAFQTTQHMTAAAGRTSTPRLQALAGITAALAARNAVDAIGSDPKVLGGVNLTATLGTTQYHSTTTTHSDRAVASTLHAGGNITISATGAGEQSTLTLSGTQISAGNVTHLKADGDLVMAAAKNTEQMTRDSRGSGHGVGVAVNLGTGGASAGLTVQGSASKGSGASTDVTWTNTRVQGGRLLVLESGGNTILRGAVASAPQLMATIGGNLDIESLQDTHQYRSKDQSIGGSFTAGVGVSGSAHLNHHTIRSDYSSVTEQSGLLAGDGGFQVTVGGHTTLMGGLITSSAAAAQAGLNALDTATLSETALDNHASYSASHVSLGGGYSRGPGGVGTDQQGRAATAEQVPGTQLPGYHGVSVAPPGVINARDASHSTTQSGISAGAITIRDQAGQQARTGQTAAETIAALNRDVLTGQDTSHTLQPIFNEQEIKAGFTIVSGLQREVGTFINNRAQEATQTQQALDSERAKPEHQRDPALIAALHQRLQDNATWDVGGTGRTIVTALNLAAGSHVTGSATQMLQGAAVNYLQSLGASQVKTLADQLDSEPARAALQGLLGCAGAAAQGQGCGAGATGAAAAVVINNLLDRATGADVASLSAAEKQQRTDTVTSLVAGITAAAGGEAAVSSAAARLETENNAVFVPVLIGALWLADKGLTAYDAWQDIKAIRSGEKTIEQVALEKGEEYIASVMIGNLAKYGVRAAKIGGRWISGKADDIAKAEKQALDQIAHNPKGPDLTSKPIGSVLEQQRIKRLDNVKGVIGKGNAKDGLVVGGVEFKAIPYDPKVKGGSNKMGNAKVFDSQVLTDQDIKNYAQQLAGDVPLKQVKPGIYLAELSDGTKVTLRSVSTSQEVTQARWTIDIKDNPSLMNITKEKVELKFR
ncbi:hemagglutinin repeat-containing protein [Xylella taiwanensis]